MLIFNSSLRDAPPLAGHLANCIQREAAGSEKLLQVAAFVAPTPFLRDAAAIQPQPDLKTERETADVWASTGQTQSVNVFSSIEAAVEEARQIALARYPETFLVLVTGSLKLVGGALCVLEGGDDDRWEKERAMQQGPQGPQGHPMPMEGVERGRPQHGGPPPQNGGPPPGGQWNGNVERRE